MTDEAFVLNQDNLERKAIGRNARYRKTGAGSRKCTLPSDRLTPKQLKELNGKVKTYNLKAPMNYADFADMPSELQWEYLIKLLTEKEGRLSDIAVMMGVNYGALRQYIARHHPGRKLPNKKGQKRPGPQWLDFIRDAEKHQETPEEPEEDCIAPETEPLHSESSAVKLTDALLCLDGGILTFTGIPQAVFQKALFVLDPSQRYRITIHFERKEENESR